jgi:hypothetical protein
MPMLFVVGQDSMKYEEKRREELNGKKGRTL